MTDKFKLPTKRLAIMQKINKDRMQHTAVIMNATVAQDAMNQPIKTWVDGSTIDCGFGFSPFKFRSRELSTYGADESSEMLVRARVPLAYQSEITTASRLRLTAGPAGPVIPPQVYEVQGFNEVGPAGMVVNLKIVEL
jgi:head-tail adaptor